MKWSAEPSQAIQVERGFSAASARPARNGPAFAVADLDDASGRSCHPGAGPIRGHAPCHPALARRRSVRRDVEAELARQLAEVVTPDNPAAGWLLTAATCLFGALLLGLVWFVLFLMRR